MSKDEYQIPNGLMRTIMESYNDGQAFDLDVAATSENSKAVHYFDAAADGVRSKWFGAVWCFPPFSKMRVYCEKALLSAVRGDTKKIVMLLQARFGARWFQQFLSGLEENQIPHTLTMLGHIRFAGERNQSQYDMVLVALGEGMHENPLESWMVRLLYFARRESQR